MQMAVIAGVTKQQIGDALVEARSSGKRPNPDYQYYAKRFSLQLVCGLALGYSDTRDPANS